MNLLPYLHSFFPILVSCGAGLLYGCSFLLQHKSIIINVDYNNRAQSIAYFLIRIGILFMIGKYLLQIPLIPSILGSIGFFCMFWLIILQVKAKPHERS